MTNSPREHHRFQPTMDSLEDRALLSGPNLVAASGTASDVRQLLSPEHHASKISLEASAPSTAETGESLTYGFVIHSDRQKTIARNLTVTVRIPEGLQVSQSNTGDWTMNAKNHTATLRIPSLKPGETMNINLHLDVTAPEGALLRTSASLRGGAGVRLAKSILHTQVIAAKEDWAVSLSDVEIIDGAALYTVTVQNPKKTPQTASRILVVTLPENIEGLPVVSSPGWTRSRDGRTLSRIVAPKSGLTQEQFTVVVRIKGPGNPAHGEVRAVLTGFAPPDANPGNDVAIDPVIVVPQASKKAGSS